MRTRLWLLATIGLLILSARDSTALSCTITASCSNVTVFKIYNVNGGHAELPTQNNYGYSVCCSENSLSNSCSGNYAIAAKLSNVTNAHVEENTRSNYAYNACLSMTNGSSVYCTYSSNCATLGSNYACLASMSDVTNAHVGSCGTYGIQICCSIIQGPILAFSLNESTAWWGDALNASGSFTSASGPIAGSTVSVNLSSKTQCSASTDSNGNWWCTLRAPMYSGTYKYTASSSSPQASSSTQLTVAVTYGLKPTGTASRGVVYVPMLMQMPDGTIRIVFVNVMVYQ